MNPRHVAALLTVAFFVEATTALARITTSYRAVELAVSPLTFGFINAAYSLVPILLAVPLGRFIDRGSEIRVAQAGSAVMMVACTGFVLLPTLAGLMAFTALFGSAFMALNIALQVTCARVAGHANFARIVGALLVANAIGQAAGAFIVGIIGGDTRLPATGSLYLATMVLAACAFVGSFLLRTQPKTETQTAPQPHISLPEIFRIPRFKVLLAMGVTCTAAVDLVLIYLPVLGNERGLTVEFVGLLLTVRSITTIAARACFIRLNALFGTYSLIVSSAVVSAISCALLLFDLPAWALYVVLAIMGFSMSICQTVTMASFIDIASPHIWGTVVSVRMIGNRLGQFAFPVAASMIATLSGVATIFAVVGFSLVAAGGAVHLRRPR